ncbi:hypothetical protein Fot_15676 [Forsythia ovata]|uniref:Uncharacterized protein n=1 Tax=Forsythia ovata TaxID=205694 RepID=A0ABD1WC83_9LAMI
MYCFNFGEEYVRCQYGTILMLLKIPHRNWRNRHIHQTNPSDMGGISVLIYYDGVWDESRTYSDYSIVGLVVPLDCSYVNLIDMIMREIKKDKSHYEVTVQYQILSNGSLDKYLH